jgi:type IV secretion system protein VirB10
MMFGFKKLLKPAKRVGGPADLSITDGSTETPLEEKKIDGERSIPNIARRNTMSKPLMIGATALSALAVAAIAFMGHDSAPDSAAKPGLADSKKTAVAAPTSTNLEPLDFGGLTATNPNAAVEKPVPALSGADAQQQAQGGQAQPIPVASRGAPRTGVPAIAAGDTGAPAGTYPSPSYSSSSGGKPAMSPEEAWRKRRMESGVTAYEREAAAGNNAPAQAQPGSAFGGGDAAVNPGDEFSSKLKVTASGEARASRVMDRNFLLARGKSTSCTTISRIDSTQAGLVTCVGDTDVYSDNGNVLLFEKGTEYIGLMRGGLQQGQARVFILWEEARTPKGVKVMLASPAADSLGATGVDGYVDNHFWQRFGGALMLSIVQDATARAGSAQSAPATAGAGQDAAAEAVRNSINIPPTLKKNHGQTVTIQVARDVDFRPVYALESAR